VKVRAIVWSTGARQCYYTGLFAAVFFLSIFTVFAVLYRLHFIKTVSFLEDAWMHNPDH